MPRFISASPKLVRNQACIRLTVDRSALVFYEPHLLVRRILTPLSPSPPQEDQRGMLRRRSYLDSGSGLASADSRQDRVVVIHRPRQFRKPIQVIQAPAVDAPQLRIDDYCPNFILRHNLASLRLCGRIFLSDRQREYEPAAPAQLAFHPNFTAVQFDELPSERQS